MGSLQNLFSRQEGGETLRLLQRSKAWGGFGTACKARVSTSSACPPELLPEAGQDLDLSTKVEVGVKGLLKVQDKPGPEQAATFIGPYLSIQA